MADAGVKGVAGQWAIGIREVGTERDSRGSGRGHRRRECQDDCKQLKTRVLLSFVMNARERCTGERREAMSAVGATPRLVDAVSVPGFPDDAGRYESSLKLNETTDAYVFGSYHSNSSRGYSDYWLLFVHGDHIEKIVDMGILSSGAHGDVQGTEQDVKFSTIPEPGRDYRGVVIQVTVKYLPDDPDDAHRPLRRGYSRLYSAIYRWDAMAGKFVTRRKRSRRSRYSTEGSTDLYNRKNAIPPRLHY